MKRSNKYPMYTYMWTYDEFSNRKKYRSGEETRNDAIAVLLAILFLIPIFLGFFMIMNEDSPSPDSGQSSSTENPYDSSNDDSSSSGGGGSDHLKGIATLNRTELTGYRLVDGTLVAFTETSTVDFSNMTSENLFGIQEGEVIVPGCQFTATMSLVNDASFALDYWMELRMPEEYFDLELAKQLKVTLTVGGKEYSTIVGSPIGDSRAPLGRISKGESVTFTVSVEFLQSADNNLSQGQEVSFDLYVTTTQAA